MGLTDYFESKIDLLPFDEIINLVHSFISNSANIYLELV